MNVLVFLLTLSVLVFVHEFAHFLAAKRAGVEVEEFGFGLPPRLFGRKFKGTLYSLNLLPVGGFVRLKGESGEVLGFGDRGSFSHASKKDRAFIILAGVLGNLVLAFFIFLILSLVGNPRFSGQVIVDGVSQGSPAFLSGLKSGDVISRIDQVVVDDMSKLVQYTDAHRGQEVELTLIREGQEVKVTAVPRVNPPENEGPLGVRLNIKGEIVYDRSSIFLAPVKAFEEVARSVYLVFFGLFSIIKTLLTFNVPQGVTGVVGIYKLSSEASGIGWRVFLQFVALLSVNLAVFNSLPIPALDGGRLIFVLAEKVLKRRISSKVETVVNNVGLAFLLVIFVLITISDIKKFWG